MRGPAHEILQQVYRDRLSGKLGFPGDGPTNLVLHRGELYAHPRHPEVRKVEEILRERPHELRGVVEEMGRTLAGREVVLEDAQVRPETLVGPLPTAWFVMEASVRGADQRELVARLGGTTARWRSGEGKRALQELPGLDPDLTHVLSRLASPLTIGELVKSEGAKSTDALRALLRLAAVGLSVSEGGDTGQEVLSPRALQLFRERIGDDLSSRPIDLDAASHRQKVADLFSRLGQLDHYQLLGVETSCDESELLDAYQRLARTVHPDHARQLGITDRNRLLEVLFERATEAYLVLDDPKRRAAYNTLSGIGVRAEIDAEKREQEKQQLARRNYSHASTCIAQMDYSQAAELLKEAARLDPRPEYFARLGQVEAKNPHWLPHAERSYRRAAEGDPDHPGFRVGWAEVLEKLGRKPEAREQFRKALELMPSNPKAQQGLERLAAAEAQTGSAAGRRGLRGLLGREK